MKATLTKTRWYFEARAPDGYVVDGCVEFSKDGSGTRQVNVYECRGARLLWSSTGFHRADAKTAKLAFEAYVEADYPKRSMPPSRIG
jgi:hypothetical protein